MRVPDAVQHLLEQFDVSDDKLRLIADKMAQEFELGLEFGKTATSSIAMLPTYVPALPNGQGCLLSLLPMPQSGASSSPSTCPGRICASCC